jgi:hypothetical protein
MMPTHPSILNRPTSVPDAPMKDLFRQIMSDLKPTSSLGGGPAHSGGAFNTCSEALWGASSLPGSLAASPLSTKHGGQQSALLSGGDMDLAGRNG